MRLFTSLALPVPVAADLADLVSTMRPLAPEVLRWSAPELWHLTLAFYGEVPGTAVDDLDARLARAAARSRPLTLQLAGLGAFPRRGGAGARVLWAGVAGDLDDLSRLAQAVAAAGRRAVSGRAAAEEPFHPHVTLARSRARGGADVRAVVTAAAGHAGPCWRADALTLVRSRLGSEVRYEPVGSWPLGTAAT